MPRNKLVSNAGEATKPFDVVKPPETIPELPARQDQEVMRLARKMDGKSLKPPPEGGGQQAHNVVTAAR